MFLVGKKTIFLIKHVLPFLSYLEFREEFPYVENKKVNWQCTPRSCNEKTLDVTSYDIMPRLYGMVYGLGKKVSDCRAHCTVFCC